MAALLSAEVRDSSGSEVLGSGLIPGLESSNELRKIKGFCFVSDLKLTGFYLNFSYYLNIQSLAS